MRYYKIYSILIVLLLAGFLVSANAQSGGLYFSLGFPMGEFKDNQKQTGVGINGELFLLTPKPKLPV